MEDRYLFKAKHIHILPGNDHLDGYWVVGFLSGERYIANDSGEYLIDPSTICQCTGLKDKNGKLIWENDIIERKEPYSEIVKYKDGDWIADYSYAYNKEAGSNYCNLGFYVKERKCVEVIGNIFDNKGLLESEG